MAAAAWLMNVDFAGGGTVIGTLQPKHMKMRPLHIREPRV